MNSWAGSAKVRKSLLFGFVSSLSPLLQAQHPRMLAVADDGIAELFALDTKLDLPDGFNRQALLKAMQGHVLAEGELVRLFQAPQ